MTKPISVSNATIKIANLALRTIIGFNEWERTKKQDIVINLEMDFDPSAALLSDAVEDTLDYKRIKRSVIDCVEQSSFNLLEKLAHAILQTIMANKEVLAARVSVDKPHALRFAESVSVSMHAERKDA